MREDTREKPILVLKPLKKAGMIPTIVYSLPFIIILGGYSIYLLSYGNIISSPFAILPILLFLLFFVVPLVHIFTHFMNLRAREYLFFNDRVEFYEGFINVERKIVRYDRVTDVGFSRSIWDRWFGTGTIRLNTAGSLWSEINIAHIKNSERIFEMIRDMLRRYSGRGTGTEFYHRVV